MIMASSSASPTHRLFCDVFLTFALQDTRGFGFRLYDALHSKGITTSVGLYFVRGDGYTKFFPKLIMPDEKFSIDSQIITLDDETSVTGDEEIFSNLFYTIEASKISVIIFSENFANSGRCLRELERILECKRMFRQIVLPIFYKVDPSNVRNQTGAFGVAFSKLQERFKDRTDKLKRWKAALVEAANLPGFTNQDHKTESLLVEATVRNILESPLIHDMHRVVGVESRVQEIESLLCNESNDVCIVGIWGIGGIGKTTIARLVFNKFIEQFEYFGFVENVREELEKGNLSDLKKKIFTRIPGYNFLKRLKGKKILFVLDDVTHYGQIEKLIGDFYSLGSGSRIIITTRDKQVLRKYAVNHTYINEIEGLSNFDALQLFSHYAFGVVFPIEDYEELSNKIVGYAKGVPLALKVLGSSLRGKTKEDWESVIKKLDKYTPMDIIKVLQVSYDGLDDEERSIFLDIACFFKGWKLYLVRDILDSSGFHTIYGLHILIQKSLISISYNTIIMHDLVQRMGMEIVRNECRQDPGKRSRLCHFEDIYNVLSKNKGSEAIEGICLDMSRIKDIHLHPHAFIKMFNLRFLKLYCSNNEDSCNKVHGFQEFVLTELRYLHWHGFPLQSLSSTIYLENLVALEMPHSNLKQLWNGSQHVVNLKRIDLSHSRNLTIIPDLSLAVNLESLILQGCTSLIEIPSSIRYLNKLVILNLSDCKSLSSLPTDIQSKCLINVLLSGCSNLKIAPSFSWSVKRLYLNGTSIKELPLIENSSRLVVLDLEDCSKLEKLPSSIFELKSLEYLTLSGCSKLDRLPHNLGNLEALLHLEAKDTAIAEIPPSFVHLERLHKLSLSQCKGQELAGLIVPPLSGLSFLTCLDLSYCQIANIPDSISSLSSLECLSLTGNNFERIPESIKDLGNLFFLDLTYCERLQSLPELPKGLNMQARSCTSLEHLSDLSFLFSHTSSGQKVNLANCFKLDESALKSKVEDALLEIQHKEFYRGLNGTLYFPGNEIPAWFKFQNMGSLIELPPGWINKSFLGFALCVVVTFRDHHIVGEDEDFFVRCICTAKSKDGEMEERLGLLDAWDGDGQEYVGSDHIFLGYHFYMCDPIDDRYIRLNNENRASIEFHVESSDCGRIGCCEVKKCGIHLLYAQDCGAPVAGSSRRFKFDEEEEEEPQRKRLKFSNKTVKKSL